MKTADAPPPGWYPAPEGGVRLRWWEGTDWSDRYHARPSAGLGDMPGMDVPLAEFVNADAARRVSSRGVDTADIIAQVRLAARAEVDRAADLFSARIRGATRDLQPLITQYTSKAFRWMKITIAIVTIILVAWVIFQVVAQVSIFEWIGDRIDNLRSSEVGFEPSG